MHKVQKRREKRRISIRWAIKVLVRHDLLHPVDGLVMRILMNCLNEKDRLEVNHSNKWETNRKKNRRNGMIHDSLYSQRH